MSAYLISDVTARDRDAFENYRSLAAASIARYGGRYLVRAGAIEPLEGGHRGRSSSSSSTIWIRRGAGIARLNMPRPSPSATGRSAVT